jgi:hypothetical protein
VASGLTLRGRLLLALAYVLLLAIVALEVPLALSLRDRVDSEVRSQARGQADVVAATVSGRLDADLAEVVAAAARSARGRVVVVDAGGVLLADSAGPDRLGSDYGGRPRSRQRCAASRPRRSAAARPSTRRSSPPRCRWSSAASGWARCA